VWYRSAMVVLGLVWTYDVLVLFSGLTTRYQRASQKKGPAPIPQQFRAAMEHLLSNFTALANEHSLEYWMCAGTLLGAVRDGGFIPWDDDVDLCAHSRMLDRLVNESAVQLSCARSGIVIGFSDDIYRVSFAKSDQGVYMDIFEMEVHCLARARSQYFSLLLLRARSVSRALVPVYLGSCSRSVLTQLSHSLALFPLFLAQTHTYTRTRTHTHTDTHQLEKPCCLSFTQVCTFFCT